MLHSIREAGDHEKQANSDSSGSRSSNWENDGSSSSDGEPDSATGSAEPNKEQSSEDSNSSSESSEYSIISSSLTVGQSSRKGVRAKAGLGGSFGGAVSGLVDVVQYSLHALQPPGPRAAVAAKAEEASLKADQEAEELARVPSLGTLLKFPEDEGPQEGVGIFAKRAQRTTVKDGHGRARLNMNIVSFETLALGFGRDKSKKESDLQKSWGEIAGKLAFILTKVDQVVPMSKARLLNEALGGQDRRMSEESRQLLQMVMQSKKFLTRAFHSLLESDPVRVLKDSLEARLNSGPGGGLFAQQEELSAYEKDISVREHQLDNPEFVDMMLQRWFAQRGFCVNNMAERRQLAEEFWKVQRANAQKRIKRQQGFGSRKSMRSSLSLEAFQSALSMQSEQEQDLSTERGILLEIRRAMTKLKRKCRVLEGQWVEQPRMMLPRLEKQCRTLRTKVEDKLSETEATRQKLCEADNRWQRSRDGYEPTLVDLELQAWDTRVELAKSVIRWVRRDRKEAQVEWNAQMAKYHADKTRMRGNFEYTVRRWREDGCLTTPGFNPWKASLAFTPDSVKLVDPDDRTQPGRVQVEQGLVISGLTRHYLINQEKLLDNAKRPLGNRWELLRRQYVSYCRVLEGQIEHWLRGDFLGPVLRKVRDLTGHLNTFIQEVLSQLEHLREGAITDLRSPNLQGDSSPSQAGAGRRSAKAKESSRADVKMEDALTAVLVHAEKEQSFLTGLTASNGELTELGRCQSELGSLAARRPFTFQDLCGESPAISRGDLPPVTFEQLEEDIESPAKAARQLARLVQINWTTYLLKWEVLIGKYKAAREGYVDYLDKVQEGARQRLLKDLKEKPHLKQELLQKTRSKMKEVEEQFHAAHVQPQMLRCKALSEGVADMTLQLQEMKSKTKHLEQDVSLNFMRSLELESHEVLLKRYQTEFEEEAARREQLDKQLADAKDRQRVAKESAKPSILIILQVYHLLRQLDEAKAEERMRRMMFLDEVVHGDQVSWEGVKAALEERGLEATSQPRQLLRVLQSVSSAWLPVNEPEEPESQSQRKNSKQADVPHGRKHSGSHTQEEAPCLISEEAVLLDSKSGMQEVEPSQTVAKPSSKDVTRRLSFLLPSSSSLGASLAGSEEEAQSARIATVSLEDLRSVHTSDEQRPSTPPPEVPQDSKVSEETVVERNEAEIIDVLLVQEEDIHMNVAMGTLQDESSNLTTEGQQEGDAGPSRVPQAVIDLTEEMEISQPEDGPVQPTDPMTPPKPIALGVSEGTSLHLDQGLNEPPDKPDTRVQEDQEVELDGDSVMNRLSNVEVPASSLASTHSARRVVTFSEDPDIDDSATLTSPDVSEQVIFDGENLKQEEESTTLPPKPLQPEVPHQPSEGSAPEMYVIPQEASRMDLVTSMRRLASKKVKRETSITTWMEEVSRALLQHTSEVADERVEEVQKQSAASASLQLLLKRRKRRRGLASSLWPELSVGNSTPATRKDFSASQPFRAKKGRLLRSDTPELQPGHVHAFLDTSSPTASRSPTGRLRKPMKANCAVAAALPDLTQGKAGKPSSSPRPSIGKLCTGTSQFRYQLSTRSFHGSGNGLKLTVGPGLEALLWGHARPRGEWRGLLQQHKEKDALGFSDLEDLVVKRPKKEKPAKRLQRRRLLQLCQAVETRVANKKLSDVGSCELTIAGRSSISKTLR